MSSLDARLTQSLILSATLEVPSQWKYVILLHQLPSVVLEYQTWHIPVCRLNLSNLPLEGREDLTVAQYQRKRIENKKDKVEAG